MLFYWSDESDNSAGSEKSDKSDRSDESDFLHFSELESVKFCILANWEGVKFAF